VDKGSPGTRWRRILSAGFAVIALSFIVLFVPIIIYAFVLAFQARGVPDQAAINHFAATISPALMPWLERLLTLLMGFWVVRRSEAARATDGLFVGIVAGLLGLAVTLAFGRQLGVSSLLPLLVMVGLGWLGGFVGQRMSPTS
jgi:hypothetical protein